MGSERGRSIDIKVGAGECIKIKTLENEFSKSRDTA